MFIKTIDQKIKNNIRGGVERARFFEQIHQELIEEYGLTEDEAIEFIEEYREKGY